MHCNFHKKNALKTELKQYILQMPSGFMNIKISLYHLQGKLNKKHHAHKTQIIGYFGLGFCL